MPKSLNTGQNRSEFRIAIDEAVNIQLKLGLFPWVSLFYLIFELYLDATFRPICDRLSQSPFLWESSGAENGLFVPAACQILPTRF